MSSYEVSVCSARESEVLVAYNRVLQVGKGAMREEGGQDALSAVAPSAYMTLKGLLLRV